MRNKQRRGSRPSTDSDRSQWAAELGKFRAFCREQGTKFMQELNRYLNPQGPRDSK